MTENPYEPSQVDDSTYNESDDSIWNRVSFASLAAVVLACCCFLGTLFLVVVFTRAGRDAGPDWVNTVGSVLMTLFFVLVPVSLFLAVVVQVKSRRLQSSARLALWLSFMMSIPATVVAVIGAIAIWRMQ